MQKNARQDIIRRVEEFKMSSNLSNLIPIISLLTVFR